MVSITLATLATALLATLTTATPLQPVIEERATAICTPGRQALLSPKAGATIDQYNDGSYPCTTFLVEYCSGQYFKTQSIDVDLLLSLPGATSGQILTLEQKPTPGVAPAGYYGYKFNATICPEDGTYLTGQYVLTVFETATGYYNPNNFVMVSEMVNLTTCK